MTEPKEIDFSVKKTESEWQDTHDNFFIKATPKIFEWLSWVITLAALTFVQHKTKSTYVSVVLGVTYFFSVAYFFAYFYQFRFKGFPLVKNQKLVLLISLFFSGLLGGLTWLLIREAVNAVVLSTP